MAWILFKAWGGVALTCVLMLELGVLVLMPTGSFEVPGRNGVYSVVWPLLPALLAVAIPSATARAGRELEVMAARDVRIVRLCFVGLAITASLLVSVTASGLDPAILARNHLLMLGLALVCRAFLAASIAWIPAVAVPIVMWLVGTHVGGAVSDWALLLLPAQSTGALFVAIGAFLAGTSAFCVKRLRS